MYALVDCDGDGIADHYCDGHEDSHFWMISSSSGCSDNNWSNGGPVCQYPNGPGCKKFLVMYLLQLITKLSL